MRTPVREMEKESGEDGRKYMNSVFNARLKLEREVNKHLLAIMWLYGHDM